MVVKKAKLVPKARGGLLSAEHNKRGVRFITISDFENQQVSLLEDWEYALLVLCDGERNEDELLELMSSAEPAEPAEVVNQAVLRRCLKFFESKALIEPLGLLRTKTVLDSPKTMAELQLAYEEWHKEPVATGQFPQWLAPWSGEEPESHPPSMEPTMTRVPLPRTPPVQVGSLIELGSAESLLVNPVVPQAQIGEEATDAPNSLTPNTQAHQILNAVYEDDPEVVEAYEAPRMDILFAVEEAVSAVESSDAVLLHGRGSDPVEKPVRFSTMEDSATVQVRATQARPPGDREETRITKSQPPRQRMETVATSPGYEPIFRLWIKHTREQMGARPLGSLVSLRKTLIGFEQSRWGELAQHLEALKALVTNEEALDRMLAALKWAQARGKGEAPPSQREDAAALLTEILRHAKASGVCVICLQTQARRFLQCRRCGFRTGAPKA